jgi:hypothetical protein
MLAPALADVVRLMRFHLAPLTFQTQLRKRIEATLAHHLYSQPGLVGSFQDAGIRDALRRVGEAPVDVLCRSSTILLSFARVSQGLALARGLPLRSRERGFSSILCSCEVRGICAS